jgi:hypothetical protein
MMKFFACLILALVVLCPVVPCSALDFEAQTGFSYQGWTADQGESGYQLYLPVDLRSAIRQLSWEIVAGYAYTEGKLEGNGDRSIGGALDTQVKLAYALPRTVGLDWLVGLDVNLPSGQTDLDPNDLKIMLDPDLVNIVSPGQGFNYNPYINLARRWNAWTFGLGAGYAFQGKYDYSTDHQDYDPGDIFNLAAETIYDWGNGLNTRLFGQYATFGTDTQGGQDLLKRGDLFLGGLGAQIQRDLYSVALTLQAIIPNKSEFRQNAASTISTEPRNSQGDEWSADLSGQYHLSSATAATAAASFMYIAANDYDKSSAFYAGERIKTALALGLSHELGKKLRLQGGLVGFVMNDGPNWLHANQDRTYYGWTISVGVSTRF